MGFPLFLLKAGMPRDSTWRTDACHYGWTDTIFSAVSLRLAQVSADWGALAGMTAVDMI